MPSLRSLSLCLVFATTGAWAQQAPSPPGAKPTEATLPAPDINQPEGRKKILDDLFNRLSRATDEREAHALQLAIERVWMRSGSDTADLLMSRAAQAMENKDWDLTSAVLDKIVILAPDWAEGWNKRATDRFTADDYPGAIEDIAHVLALEPRHFGALAGLGFMFQRMDMKKGALAAFRKALEINPAQDDLRKTVQKLTVEVDGRDI